MAIQMIDLLAQRARIKERLDAAIEAVLESGAFVMGPQICALEEALSAFTGAGRTLTCANGTDALLLPLLAWGVGEGDAVFCPSFTFVATAEIIAWLGATPVFVDILPDTYNIDPDHLDREIARVRREGALAPKAVIAVDLFGQLADYPRLAGIARKHGLKLVSDNAQGFGATLAGAHPIKWADVVTTSFYPAKPLGCYGDGGAVQTDDAALWDVMDSLRIHGKATSRDAEGRDFAHDPKYLNLRVGLNSRLDTIQAAILLEKLAIFPDEILRRQTVARRYNEGLKGAVLKTPILRDGAVSVWAQYTIEADNRDGLAAGLKSGGVPTAVYYPVPMHRQAPYRRFAAGALPVTEAKAETVISLPMHAYLDEKTQDRIIEAVRAFAGRAA
ncbi:MAG: DegT/DnrJ/EryC1/StrS family aminotransferase [Amphiplicatus sp.]